MNLQRLDTTSGIVQNSQVRVIVQRIPYNGGGAVQGPVTIQNSVVTLSNNATTVNLPHTQRRRHLHHHAAAAVGRRRSSRSRSPSTPSSAWTTPTSSTADGNAQQQYYCEGGDQQLWNFRPVAGVADTYTVVNQQTGKCLDVAGVVHRGRRRRPSVDLPPAASNQQFALRKVTYAGNDSHDYQLVARHSGKCVDVSEISTAAAGADPPVDLQPGWQGSPLNQTWRLWGR